MRPTLPPRPISQSALRHGAETQMDSDTDHIQGGITAIKLRLESQLDPSLQLRGPPMKRPPPPPPLKPKPSINADVPSQTAPIPARPKPVVPPRPRTQSATSTSNSCSPTVSKPAVPARPNAQNRAVPPRPKPKPQRNSFEHDNTTHSPHNSNVDTSDVANWHAAMLKLDSAHGITVGSPVLPRTLQNMDFAHLDEYAINTPQHETQSIHGLAAYLTFPFDDALSKIRAIFCWVASNIEYDYKGFITGQMKPQDANSILHSRSSVCEGYANLFLALCKAATTQTPQGHESITAFKISGAARGVGVEPGDPAVDLDAHAWNAVLIHGEYRFIECTWAAGSIMNQQYHKQYVPGPYFLVHPLDFVQTHISKSDPKEQFLSNPLTHQEWAALPMMSSAARLNGMRLVNSNGILPTNQGCLLSFLEIHDDYLEISIELDTELFQSTGGIVMAHVTHGQLVPVTKKSASTVWVDGVHHRDSIISKGGQPQSLLWYTTASRRPGKTNCVVRGFVPHGDLVCDVMASVDPGVRMYHNAMKFRVKNHGPGNRGLPPKSFGGSVRLVEPLIGTLRLGEQVRFKVQGDLDGVVITPGKSVLCMRREGDFQVQDLRIDERGTYSVGHGDWRSYSFGGQYVAE
ncbi:hypothetical protein HDU81_003183 [Chytriomyces hyalinus]|nr:hypothetical protein HDU81_003183 [Chytriomyces hyalinus]